MCLSALQERVSLGLDKIVAMGLDYTGMARQGD